MKAKPTKINGGFCLWMVGLLILGIILAFVFRDKSGEASDKSSAVIACQVEVKHKLKAPSTAEFPLSREANIKDLGGGEFSAVSYVDAENSFGVKIRSNWVCRFLFRSQNDYQVLSAEITEE